MKKLISIIILMSLFSITYAAESKSPSYILVEDLTSIELSDMERRIRAKLGILKKQLGEKHKAVVELSDGFFDYFRWDETLLYGGVTFKGHLLLTDYNEKYQLSLTCFQVLTFFLALALS